MEKFKHICCTVTNDLIQDQRMHRICTSLTHLGYKVTLVGRQKPDSAPLPKQAYAQHRIPCRFQSGFLFYAEYNIRLLFYLLFVPKADIIYSVDADTLAACTVTKIIRRKKMVFDAHEYFTETPEVMDRPMVKTVWKVIEYICIPAAQAHITVNQSLADIFSKKFKKPFVALYNAPLKKENIPADAPPKKPYFLYQGMLNAGRGLEAMIAAMLWIPDYELWIVGEGDISATLKTLARESLASDRIQFKGWKNAGEMQKMASEATLGINLLISESKSYYYSLANKFFDYMHAGIPSVQMDFPEYRNIMAQYETGLLLNALDPQIIASHIHQLLRDPVRYAAMKDRCREAAHVYCWENEEKKLRELMSCL